MPGTVTARGPETYTATVGRTGQFSMTVQPGWYTVTATSPLYDDGTATCRHFGALDVPAEATTHVDVECMEK